MSLQSMVAKMFGREEPVIKAIDNGKLQLNIKCFSCDKPCFVIVEQKQYETYQNGALVQNAFPTLSRDECELIISHTCSECFDSMTKENEDEE